MPAQKAPIEPKARTGLRQKYLVTLADGKEHEIQTELSDILRFERDHEGQPFLEVRFSIDAQLWVIWRAGRRLQTWTDPDQKAWADTVLDYGYADDDEPEDADHRDPTQPAPSA